MKVQFDIAAPKVVKATIFTKDAVGEGIAICSILDDWEFSERKGKNIAAGRAVKALVNQESSELIRDDYNYFPSSWTFKRADRVMGVAFEEGPYKSSFARIC